MTNTIEHNSATCHLGPHGEQCWACKWAEQKYVTARAAVHDPDNCLLGPNDLPCDKCVEKLQDNIAQSAATIRARRAALLERATPDALTEGALALAEAYLSDEAWYRHLPNNAMQDAEILALAAVIEEVIGMRLRMCQREREQGDR